MLHVVWGQTDEGRPYSNPAESSLESGLPATTPNVAEASSWSPSRLVRRKLEDKYLVNQLQHKRAPGPTDNERTAGSVAAQEIRQVSW